MAYLGLIAYTIRLADDWRRRRERRRTRFIIEGLPASIRKDIGWPDPNPGADWPFSTRGRRL